MIKLSREEEKNVLSEMKTMCQRTKKYERYSEVPSGITEIYLHLIRRYRNELKWAISEYSLPSLSCWRYWRLRWKLKRLNIIYNKKGKDKEKNGNRNRHRY